MTKRPDSVPESRNEPPRSRTEPEPRGRLRLGPRDDDLLCDLYLHGAMSRGQLESLYFGSVPRCNARLRQLFDHRLVRRFLPPCSTSGSQAVYGLGRAAAERVAARLGTDPAAVRKGCRDRTPAFLEHTLAIVDFRIALRRAAEGRPELEIESWMPESLCRHAYEIRVPGGGWKKEVFRPDAFARLLRRRTGEYLPYFVEIDLGHTSSGEFAGKLRVHGRYLESGLFREMYGGERFATLVATTGPRRAGNLLALAERQKCGIFWFATFDEIREAGAFGPVWRVPFSPDRLSIA